MNQKLKILGPYTPEHEGPFCTEDLRIVEIKMRDGRGSFPVKGYISDETELTEWTDNGECLGMGKKTDLMNAEEVPQPREFWMALSNSGGRITCTSPEQAHQAFTPEYRKEVIHVREVLPGEGE